MNKYNRYSLIFGIFLIALSMKAETLQTVPHVDLQKYAGKWYEIASYPQKFEKNCCSTTAEYTMTDKKYVIVENRCYKNCLKSNQSYIKGKAFVVQNSGNAKLKVQFFWPFKGDYWIIDLDDEYTYAVISEPKMKYLWILSRTPNMKETIYQQILSRLIEKGFDLTHLIKTPQLEE